MSTDQTGDAVSYPARRYAWYVVILLTAAYIIAYIDRQFLGLVISPVKQTLKLSDTQLGLLLGPAFAIFYVILGYPIGWLADRRSRRGLIAWGMALWCVLHSLCGVAGNFSQLFMARIGVGVGEATLNPAALSLIGDLFPKAQRVRAISVYHWGISLGGGLAYLVGGVGVSWIMSQPPLVLPVFGELFAWQTAFLVIGLPGLIVPFLFMLTVREPVRHERIAGQSSGAGAALRYMAKRWRAYLPAMLSVSGFTFANYNGFWNAALFDRTWGWSIGQTSAALGVTLVIGGPLGTMLGATLVGYFAKRGYRDATLRSAIVGVTLIVLANVAYPLMPSPWLAVAAYFPAVLAGGITVASGASAVVNLAPNQIRAQASAIYVMLISFIGLSGPSIVGWINDHVFGDPASLRFSLALAMGVFGPLLLVFLVWGLKHFAAGMVEVEAAEK